MPVASKTPTPPKRAIRVAPSTGLSSTPNARAIDRARQPIARHHTTGRSANPWTFAATLRIAAKVQGLALLPVVWCVAIGCLALSIALAFGAEDRPVLGATLIALVGGL